MQWEELGEQVDPVDGGDLLAMALIQKVPVKVSACRPNFALSTTSREATSYDLIELRQAAGTRIIDAALGARLPAQAGRLFSVEYSDGGTETYRYCPTCSVHGLVAGLLKVGDGRANSACVNNK